MFAFAVRVTANQVYKMGNTGSRPTLDKARQREHRPTPHLHPERVSGRTDAHQHRVLPADMHGLGGAADEATVRNTEALLLSPRTTVID